MNPLDMRGPEFLLFYLVYGVGVIGTAWFLRRAWTSSLPPPTASRWMPGYYPREGDAYPIAVLRGGPLEAARTLVGRLLAADLLVLEGGSLRSSPEAAGADQRLAPIEEEALAAVSGPAPLASRDAVSRIAQALEPRTREMQEELERQGLLYGPDQRRRFRTLFLLTLLAVPGLGVTKLLVALSRGRTNVGFLILLLVVYTLLVVLLLRPRRRTPTGDRYLSWLRDTHQELVAVLRKGQGERQGEMVLAAGIYGLAALPALSTLGAESPRRRDPRADAGSPGGGSGDGGGSDSSFLDSGGWDGGGDSGGGDSGGGDSGGSSCGSSCGGGCGGGGCGGCGGG